MNSSLFFSYLGNNLLYQQARFKVIIYYYRYSFILQSYRIADVLYTSMIVQIKRIIIPLMLGPGLNIMVKAIGPCKNLNNAQKLNVI